MNWQQIEQRIQTEIRPQHSRILKTDGNERRLVTSNNGQSISMRTGVKTNARKSITYEMIRYAFDTLSQKGRFDSADFRSQYSKEYANGGCIYSMTGGTLVELGLATLVPIRNGKSCYYLKKW